MRAVFERRIARAAALAELWPAAGEVLRLFRSASALQADVAEQIAVAHSSHPRELASFLPRAVELARRDAPAGLAAVADRWQSLRREGWEAALDLFLSGATQDPSDRFLSKLLLEPYYAAARMTSRPAPRRTAASHQACEHCGSPPGAGILWEDPAAGAIVRSCVCSLCAHEWRAPRVACPGCAEEAPDSLPRYSAAEIPWIRIEACDACRTYLKSVDRTAAPEAEPVADEVASLALDVLAQERGYTKLEPNLAGL